MHLNAMPTTNPADGSSALSPPKKPKKVYRTEFCAAHRACNTTAEREQLALIIKARWTEEELQEFARLYCFRRGRDYPTAASYHHAIAYISFCATTPLLQREGMVDCHGQFVHIKYTDPLTWRKLFRRGGSKVLPPRSPDLLRRGGVGVIGSSDYSWPDHTDEYRSMIEQRCRDYFKNIPPDQPVPSSAWYASNHWYRREQHELQQAAELAKYSLLPKALKKSPPKGYKVVSSYLHVGSSGGGFYTINGTLRPHFEREFKGHTPEFREEVEALARKDNHMRPRASVSRARWETACHKHFALIKRSSEA
jgi:hypothetical protein